MVCCATIGTLWALKVTRVRMTLLLRRPVHVYQERPPSCGGRWLVECEPRAVFYAYHDKSAAVVRAYRLARALGRRLKITH